MTTKVIPVIFGRARTTTTMRRDQYDYGQELHISEGIHLTQTFEAHFCCEGDSETVSMIGQNNVVTVPDECFTTGRTILCFIYVHDGDSDGRTLYTIRIPIARRPRPSDVEPTPVQQDVITQTIAALTAAREDIEDIAADAHRAIEDAIEGVIDDTVERVVTEAVEEAKASGDFKGDKGDKGDPGEPGPKGDTGDTGAKGDTGDKGDKGDPFTYADFTPAQLAALTGPKGDKGDKGDTGDTGHSPVVTASKSGTTTTISVDGTPIAEVLDGAKGSDGDDGHTPVITASKSEGVTTISVDGSAVAQISDGDDGDDGHTPVITASKSGKVTTVSVDGSAVATINDGTDGAAGHSPVVTASKAGGVTTVSVDGTAIAAINDGAAGDDGDDGVSPTCTITDITGGHRVTIVDAQGSHYFDVMDGDDASAVVSILSPSGNTHTLLPCPTTYNFGEKSTLTVTVTAATQYHFAFECPTGSATVLDIIGVTGMAGDALEAGKRYEVDVWAGIALIKEMEVVTE